MTPQWKTSSVIWLLNASSAETNVERRAFQTGYVEGDVRSEIFSIACEGLVDCLGWLLGGAYARCE
jgi:hypothetical protein